MCQVSKLSRTIRRPGPVGPSLVRVSGESSVQEPNIRTQELDDIIIAPLSKCCAMFGKYVDLEGSLSGARCFPSSLNFLCAIDFVRTRTFLPACLEPLLHCASVSPLCSNTLGLGRSRCEDRLLEKQISSRYWKPLAMCCRFSGPTMLCHVSMIFGRRPSSQHQEASQKSFSTVDTRLIVDLISRIEVAVSILQSKVPFSMMFSSIPLLDLAAQALDLDTSNPRTANLVRL